MPFITDDTDYIKVVERSVDKQSEEILLEDAKKIYTHNQKEIRKINKKYSEKLDKVKLLLNVDVLSKEDREQILLLMGYNEEIKPYLEEQELIENYLIRNKKVLSRKR